MITRLIGARNVGILGVFLLIQVGCAAPAKDTTMRGPCEVPHGQNALRAEQDATRVSHLISGEVSRVDGTTYVLKDESGKEVNLQIDEKTEKPPINQGDRVSANVDNQNHALWIRANRGTDRRTEHVSADCNPS